MSAEMIYTAILQIREHIFFVITGIPTIADITKPENYTQHFKPSSFPQLHIQVLVLSIDNE